MDGFFVLFLVVVIAISIVYEQYLNNEIWIWIAREVKSNGGELIALRKLRNFQKGKDRKYEVVLASTSGEEYTTTCKVDWHNSDLYWTRTPVELLGIEGMTPAEIRQTNRVLAELNSAFRFARLAAVQTLANENYIPHEILERVAQIAAEDEDPQVREEAKKIIRGAGVYG